MWVVATGTNSCHSTPAFAQRRSLFAQQISHHVRPCSPCKKSSSCPRQTCRSHCEENGRNRRVDRHSEHKPRAGEDKAAANKCSAMLVHASVSPTTNTLSTQHSATTPELTNSLKLSGALPVCCQEAARHSPHCGHAGGLQAKWVQQVLQQAICTSSGDDSSVRDGSRGQARSATASAWKVRLARVHPKACFII